jgi:hypothetical protein
MAVTERAVGSETQARDRARRIFVRATVVWLAVALVFWVWYLATQPFVPQFLYPYLWLGLVGVPIWLGRRKLETRLRLWHIPGFLKFALLGYGMVLAEEVLAALCNNLSERFEPGLYLQRIGQFWAFNVLAFTGLIVGWYLLARFVGYSRTEMFYVVGIFGLYSERTFLVLPTNPLAFVLFAPLIIFTYGLILTPAMLSLPERRRRGWSFLVRYPLALLVPYICSILPVGLLMALRTAYPGWFPPTTFIP